MEKTSVQLELDTILALDKVAAKRGMNRSQVMRKAIEDFLAECKKAGEF